MRTVPEASEPIPETENVTVYNWTAKLAVIDPYPLIVAVVEGDDALAKVMADVLDDQPAN